MKVIKVAVAWLAVMLISLLLMACSSRPTPDKPPEELTQCIPEWELNPPTSKTGLYGIGIAKMQHATLSKKTADARAREELAMAIQTKVETRLRDFMQKNSLDDNARSRRLFTSVSQQISSQVLHGSKVLKRRICPDGTWHSLAFWPMDQADALKEAINSQTRAFIDREAGLSNEFKAKNSVENLQTELKSLDFMESVVAD